MISQSDVGARLRLFRYGLVVIVVITFLISLVAPYVALRGAGDAAPAITEFIDEALIFTVVVAVIALIAYFAYKSILERTVAS